MSAIYNRRQALVALSAAGMTIPLRLNEVENKTTDFRNYFSLRAMEADRSLKEGAVVCTAGYFSPGDGGNGQYIIKRAFPEMKPDGGSCILLPSGFVAMLINANSVNYKMFGAVCDGKNDDGVQIKAAHAYANTCRLPVINLSGEFWINETENIQIQESVQWGSSIFHINERYHKSQEYYRFDITSRTAPVDIELDSKMKAKLLERIKPGVNIIPELAAFRNCLVFIADSNDHIGYRCCEEYENKQWWAREEFFYVEEHGRILGDIAWTFKDYTELKAYSAETEYLTVDGGTFYMSGNNPEEFHWRIGFQIQRSRTIIRNQWVGLEKGILNPFTPRNGFYWFTHAYDVTLENVRLFPCEYKRDGKRIVDGGYGLLIDRVLNSVFRNVTAEGSSSHWGVFGTNLNKNFRIERCQLNRVDIHFHCWNLTVVDSQIGVEGINVTGGGDLLIENTTVTSNRFLVFRRDFGSRWDGHIRVLHCRQKRPSPQMDAIRSAAILEFDPNLSYEYKYPIGYGRTIRVEDLVIDASDAPDAGDDIWLMSMPQSDDRSQPVFFPYDCIFKDIWVEGRSKGVKLMPLPDLSNLYSLSTINHRPTDNMPNARLLFSNVALDKPDEAILKAGKAFHLQIAPRRKQTAETLFYPEIIIENCRDFAGDFGDQTANVSFENCSLSKIIVGKNKLKGNIQFKFCNFTPIGYDGAEQAFQLEAERGVEFLCCEIHAPAKDGTANPEWLHQLGFIEINKSLRFNHLHTRLGSNAVDMLQNQRVKLSKEFMAKLQNSFEV